ncbi:MAG: GTP cyclohydrolase I FolE [archaeon]
MITIENEIQDIDSFVECELCKKKFRTVTNTHLWKEHKITLDEYEEKFPEAITWSKNSRKACSKSTKGRTYEQIYGEEKAEELKKEKSSLTKKQMEDPEQRKIRSDLFTGRAVTNKTRRKMSEVRKKLYEDSPRKYSYRQRALDYYGPVCMNCGFEPNEDSESVVHHIDFKNTSSPLGNHEIENLRVLCKSCHAKLHVCLDKTVKGFTGIPRIEKSIYSLLSSLGKEFQIDLNDGNFTDTPNRISRMYLEILSGSVDTKKQIEDVLSSKFPSKGFDEMILLKGVKTFSLCPHHLLPAEYDINIAYLPSEEGFVLGLSKLARICNILSSRLVLQEVLTMEIGNALENINPKGVAVLVKGQHMCVRMRGIKSTNSEFITSYTSGAFRENASTRSEFFSAIK